MGDILSQWDFKDNPDKASPAIFQTTYKLFVKLVFEDDLGEQKAMIMFNNWYFRQGRLEKMVLCQELISRAMLSTHLILL